MLVFLCELSVPVYNDVLQLSNDMASIQWFVLQLFKHRSGNIEYVHYVYAKLFQKKHALKSTTLQAKCKQEITS